MKKMKLIMAALILGILFCGIRTYASSPYALWKPALGPSLGIYYVSDGYGSGKVLVYDIDKIPAELIYSKPIKNGWSSDYPSKCIQHGDTCVISAFTYDYDGQVLLLKLTYHPLQKPQIQLEEQVINLPSASRSSKPTKKV